MGDFIGFGTDKSQTATGPTTTVNTTTTTTMRDVGVTGQQAVDITRAINEGEIYRSEINSDLIKTLVQETGKNYTNLVGGAGMLVNAAQVQARDTIQGGEITSAALVDASQKAGQMDFEPVMKLSVIAILATVAILQYGKGK